jgi:hypothetical protein
MVYYLSRGDLMQSRIGEFLIKIGAMNDDQVKKVLQLQEEGDERIFGEIALGLGFLNDDAIKRYVDHLSTAKNAIHPDNDVEEL